VLFFFQLGQRDLASSHEARAGQDAQSMLDSGAWDLPRLFDGQVEMQKPPLYYWLVALLGLTNGGQVNAWCVRLPAALSALACVWLLAWWGGRQGRPLAGFLAAVMLATFLHFTTLARTGRIDMPLTLTVSLTLIGFVEGTSQPLRQVGGSGWRWFLLSYLATAAGVLLKGPIALALPLAVALAWWPARRWFCDSQNTPLSFRPLAASLLWGIPLLLALTLPWFIWANLQTDGDFFRVFFWHHNIDRGFGTEDRLRAYPWWFYGVHAMVDLLPWSLLVPLAAASLWRQRDRAAGFGAVWLLAMLVLLSCMRFKRADYLLPAFPGAAWMLGCTLERWYQRARSRRLLAAFASVAGATALLWFAYLALVIPQVEQTRTHRLFADVIRDHTKDPVLFFWTEAHLIAFRAGPPLTTSVEWPDLDNWAGRPQTSYAVMPVALLGEWSKHVKQGQLIPVAYSAQLAPPPAQWPALLKIAAAIGLDNLDNREREYVLVRTCRLPPSAPIPYTNR
jgi:4-amino-4-deoxy-L-arabinose transferase-like glycosyltransferase